MPGHEEVEVSYTVEITDKNYLTLVELRGIEPLTSAVRLQFP
jgi:hypothetical protein